LSLLRPRWMFVALPVLAQHLLSVRSSEWQIEFHYAAPLIPLFWMAASEAVADLWSPRPLALAVGVGCVATQIWMGPLRVLATANRDDNGAPEKRAIVQSISPQASVVAGLPYLSHLAERQELVSLHHVLKGLRTLSRNPWVPPAPTDIVIVDYDDQATFNTIAGYYHPKMQMAKGQVIPSSDVLLSTFLQKASWKVEAHDSITVFRKVAAESEPQIEMPTGTVEKQQIGTGNELLLIQSRFAQSGSITVQSVWQFHGERSVIPWMSVVFVPIGENKQERKSVWLTRGLCVPQGSDNGRPWKDTWVADITTRVPKGKYQLRAVFYDNSKFAWAQMENPAAPLPALGGADLGVVEVK